MDDMLRGPVEQVRRATALRGSLVASSRAERSLLLANTDALVRHYLEELDLFRKEVQTGRDQLEAVATPEEKRKLLRPLRSSGTSLPPHRIRCGISCNEIP